ncbi:sigma-70 family RNA polymerase sigma factor [Nocardioides nitrophenolicus]|uniref:sigma-70 family RNA polymerase sigma factor n=1 Tax=Nocardioides nitrophenolicus TaxID=60489 RepID=UPI00195767CE|nr:sigma-70 family RNA polymerase sigma factor [Nocardioides nitrophenolicus]MBM7519736.1 RNA polymerase sigma factor (sigma-70 family) [Nocardioides nitrophenolicus]
MTAKRQVAAAGFEEAYRAHRVELVRLAYLMSGSHETSEDVVQAVFASAHQRWEAIENPPAYLRRAVVNAVKGEQRRVLRRRARVPERPRVELPPEIDEMWARVARLPWVQRAVVVLHYYEDLPLAEVALVVGRPASTVRSDHRRALDKLRKEMS